MLVPCSTANSTVLENEEKNDTKYQSGLSHVSPPILGNQIIQFVVSIALMSSKCHLISFSCLQTHP